MSAPEPDGLAYAPVPLSTAHNAGGLHHDLLNPESRQPIQQRQQPRDRRLKLRNVLLARATLARDPHARGDLLLVHIQRRRALHYRLHLTCQNVIDKIVARGL